MSKGSWRRPENRKAIESNWPLGNKLPASANLMSIPEHDYRFELSTCKVPPMGWYCTRGSGHDGPCAAIPDPKPNTNNYAHPDDAARALRNWKKRNGQ